MEDADTSIWPEKCVNLYLTNYLSRKENAKTVEQLNNEEFIIRAGNSSKVVVAGTCKIKLPSNLNLSQRAKLPTILKIWDGVRSLLAVNMNVSMLIGTIEYIHFSIRPSKYDRQSIR